VPRPKLSLTAAVGLAIRDTRKEQGLSQDILADGAATHRNYIGQIERGEVSTSIKNVEAIAKALRIPASELVARAERLLNG
jgi:transcriptional regulator with XRE-family HTH domain